MECTIGNLGQEIQQPSNPFVNLSQFGLLWCQVNPLKVMVPDLDPPSPPLPWGVINLRQGYALLRAQERYTCLIHPKEASSLLCYIGGVPENSDSWCPKVTWWACLWLPNGQVAGLHWKDRAVSRNHPPTQSALTIQTGHGRWCLLMGQWVSWPHERWTGHSYFFKNWYCGLAKPTRWIDPAKFALDGGSTNKLSSMCIMGQLMD